jgi:hypothetical protein
MIQRKGETAMSWTLVQQEPLDGAAAGAPQPTDLLVAPTAEKQEADGETSPWGPGVLWQPMMLLLQQAEALGDLGAAGAREEPATAEELGPDWAAFGTDWYWAHNGTRMNGWIRLCIKGKLESKWGMGTWKCLERDRIPVQQSPVMLVTFGGVEHALRLQMFHAEGHSEAARFDVVSLRRLKDGQPSLADDRNGSNALKATAPACCTTQGWHMPGGFKDAVPHCTNHVNRKE